MTSYICRFILQRLHTTVSVQYRTHSQRIDITGIVAGLKPTGFPIKKWKTHTKENTIWNFFSSLDTREAGVARVRYWVWQVGHWRQWGQHLRETDSDSRLWVRPEQRVHLHPHFCCQAGQVPGSKVSLFFFRCIGYRYQLCGSQRFDPNPTFHFEPNRILLRFVGKYWRSKCSAFQNIYTSNFFTPFFNVQVLM